MLKYPLTECSSCAHKHVCKFVDYLNNLQKSGKLPFDVDEGECQYWEPDENYNNELAKEGADNPLELSGLSELIKNQQPTSQAFPIDGINSLIDKGLLEPTTIPPEEVDADDLYKQVNGALKYSKHSGMSDPEAITFSETTMKMFDPDMFTAVQYEGIEHDGLVTEFGTLPVIIENQIPPGIFGFIYVAEDDEE